MKNLFSFLLLVAFISFTSCGSDSDCTADSFIGTFTGEVDCDGDTTSGTLVITKISETEISVTDVDGDSTTLELDGCKATASESIPGLGSTSVELTLDGDNLKYKQTGEVFGISISCSGTFTR